MKRNVLLTTDFSENSKRAFKGAVSLAKKLDGKLILCYVVNDMDYVPSVSPIGGESVQSVILQKEFLDKEVERIINYAYRKTITIIEQNVESLSKISKSLVKYNSINSTVLEDITVSYS